MDVRLASANSDVMTIHKNINVADPVLSADWLQCDRLLCSLCVRTNETDAIPSTRQVIISADQFSNLLPQDRGSGSSELTYSYQVTDQCGTETVSCDIHTDEQSYSKTQLSESLLDNCLSLLLQQLHMSYLCYHGYLEDRAIIRVTKKPLIFQSSADTPQRLLAFSQQLSENILNEAVQLSACGGSHDLCDQEPLKTDAAVHEASSPDGQNNSSFDAHSNSGPHRQGGVDFVNIPVQVELGINGTSSCDTDHYPSCDIGPFKKIVLVEEVDQTSDEKVGTTFRPHHVQQDCIVEELSREMSSSGTSPSSPEDLNEADCIQTFTKRLISDVLRSSTLDAALNVPRDVCNSLNEAHDDGTVLTHHNGDAEGLADNQVPCLQATDGITTDGSTMDGNVNGTASNAQVTRQEIEVLVDQMIKEAFDAGFKQLESVARGNTVRCAVYPPELLENIDEFAENLVADAFNSALYQVREYLLQRSHCHHCRGTGNQIGIYMSDKALDREWNAQLTAFVDDFVLNIMEEALFIKKMQVSDSHVRTNSRERKHTSSDCQVYGSASTAADGALEKGSHSDVSIDTKYFEDEFSVDFRNSLENQKHGANTSFNRHYLRTNYSSGSSQRGSYDDETVHAGCRRSSMGFRDVVLSEFEDELIHSDISTPSLGMFDNCDPISQRRASEPLDLNSAEIPQPKNKKRAQSVDSGASRRVILQWLDKQVSSASSSHSVANHKRTSSHLDWFAQDLLVEAFNDAFVTLFGPDYEGLQELTQPARKDRITSLQQFADVLSVQILTESIKEIVTHRWSLKAGSDYLSAADSQDDYLDALDLPLTELEKIADEFSHRILQEALDIVRNDVTSKEIIKELMQGNIQLSALIQWAAATRAGVSHLVLSTLALSELEELSQVVDCLRRHSYSVADLMHLILSYIEERLDKTSSDSLYAYILHRLQAP